jgi:hypothetical protein
MEQLDRQAHKELLEQQDQQVLMEVTEQILQ